MKKSRSREVLISQVHMVRNEIQVSWFLVWYFSRILSLWYHGRENHMKGKKRVTGCVALAHLSSPSNTSQGEGHREGSRLWPNWCPLPASMHKAHWTSTAAPLLPDGPGGPGGCMIDQSPLWFWACLCLLHSLSKLYISTVLENISEEIILLVHCFKNTFSLDCKETNFKLG